MLVHALRFGRSLAGMSLECQKADAKVHHSSEHLISTKKSSCQTGTVYVYVALRDGCKYSETPGEPAAKTLDQRQVRISTVYF